MKVQVIYSSLSGCTRKLAEGIYNGLPNVKKTIHDLKNGVPALDGDVLLLGYWVDKGGPNAEMKALMEQVEGKHVGLFCTLAFWADASHGHGSLHNGWKLVQEKNTVIGGIVCNGCMSRQMIGSFRKMTSGPHSASPASEARWALIQGHPSAAEIALAAERFSERLFLLQMLEEKGISYPSVAI